MFLAIDKFENWVTIGIMLIGMILFLHILAMAGFHLGKMLGIADD